MPFFYLKNYTAAELKLLNECRMFLKVVTLADLCNIAGDRLLMDSYNGIPQEQRYHSYNWPRQPTKLSSDHWHLWQQALETHFVRTGAHDTKALQVPLGAWLIDPRSHWNWFFQPSTDTLFQRNGEHFTAYSSRRPTRHSSTRAVYQLLDVAPTLPPDIDLASVQTRQAGGYHLVSTTPTTPPPQAPPPPVPTTLLEAASQLAPQEQWATHTLTSLDEGKALAMALTTDKIIAVSDGSHQDDLATSGFILTTKNPKEELSIPPIHGSNIIPGTPEDQDSYRGELGRVMGIVTTLQLLCKLHNITNGATQIGLDGKEAKNSVFSERPPRVFSPSYDLIMAIRRKIAALPLTITGKHIKGHQDKKKHRSKLG